MFHGGSGFSDLHTRGCRLGRGGLASCLCLSGRHSDFGVSKVYYCLFAANRTSVLPYQDSFLLLYQKTRIGRLLLLPDTIA